MLTLGDREEFLQKMYETCWNNVTRAEDAVWKVFAAYTAVLAGTSIAKDMIGFFGFDLLVMAFSFVGMFASINANSWFTRNMGIIANLEKNFIPDDLNKIIPRNWTTSKVPFFNSEIWWIMFFLFPIIIFATTYVVYDKLTDVEKQVISIGIIVGCIATFVYYLWLHLRHKKFEKDAPG